MGQSNGQAGEKPAAEKNGTDKLDRSAERSGGTLRSDRFLRAVGKHKGAVLVSHVHPDPDSLGAMMGLRFLIQEKLGLPSVLCRDGLIGRAENRAMVACLKIDLVPIEDIDWKQDRAVVMVDSQPNTGRHTIPADVKIHAVIDHHEVSGDLDSAPFVDLRSSVGATCTIVTNYLMEQQLEPSPKLATALFYGIESELTGFPREATKQDDAAAIFLYERVQKDLLAQIHNARLPHSYFETLIEALQNAFTYDKVIASWVGELPQAELAAEIADFLIRFEEVEWSFCAGVYQDQMVMSLRSIHADGKAASVLQEVAEGLGRAGGHDRRAGGSIPLASAAPTALEQLRAQLRKRLLAALEIDECRGQRLVSRREQLLNLQG